MTPHLGLIKFFGLELLAQAEHSDAEALHQSPLSIWNGINYELQVLHQDPIRFYKVVLRNRKDVIVRAISLSVINITFCR